MYKKFMYGKNTGPRTKSMLAKYLSLYYHNWKEPFSFCHQRHESKSLKIVKSSQVDHEAPYDQHRILSRM